MEQEPRDLGRAQRCYADGRVRTRYGSRGLGRWCCRRPRRLRSGDTSFGKSLVGAFHQPSLVLVDPAVLSTLPAPQFASGLAVAFKHGLILDATYFESMAGGLESVFGRDPERLTELITGSLEIKAGVVSRDGRGGGYREVLNFGHTIAAAQEAILGYAWLYGESVAAGMVLEAAIGEAAEVTRSRVAGRIREVLEAAGLPVALDEDVDPSRFFEALGRGARRAGRARCRKRWCDRCCSSRGVGGFDG